MKKTLVSIILALVLVLSCAVAENSPSLEETIVGKLTSVNGANLEGVSIILSTIEPETPEEAAFLKASEEGFEGIELSDEAVMDEFHKLTVSGYTPECGDILAAFGYATEYEADTKLTAIVGIINGEATEWTALEANVGEDGVVVNFPQAILEAASTNNAAMALVRG